MRVKFIQCYICNKNISEILIDVRDNKPRPCSECEEVIRETVEEYDVDHVYNQIPTEDEQGVLPGFGEWGQPDFFTR